MKILYDHQIFSLQKWGGISRCFAELINGLSSNSNNTIITSITTSDNQYIGYGYDVVPSFFGQAKFKIQFIINSISSIRCIIFSRFDVFHPTYFSTFFLPFLFGRPFVLTIHDMTHEKFRDEFLYADKLIKNKLTLARKATRIIAVSQNTKSDVVSILGVSPDKIDVIHHGNSFNAASEVRVLDLPSKYVLFVGRRSGYKNFNSFISAMQSVDSSIVCIGGGKFTGQEIALIKKYDLANRITQKALDDDEMAYVYGNAEAFVFPSLYEGFGIPILEAFACECPVVCSNTGSLPEVAADAAEYFNPDDVGSMKSAIVKVLGSLQKQKALIALGSTRLKDFSWDKTVVKTIETYEKTIEN